MANDTGSWIVSLHNTQGSMAEACDPRVSFRVDGEVLADILIERLEAALDGDAWYATAVPVIETGSDIDTAFHKAVKVALDDDQESEEDDLPDAFAEAQRSDDPESKTSAWDILGVAPNWPHNQR